MHGSVNNDIRTVEGKLKKTHEETLKLNKDIEMIYLDIGSKQLEVDAQLKEEKELRSHLDSLHSHPMKSSNS